jgi:hypothetical protein
MTMRTRTVPDRRPLRALFAALLASGVAVSTLAPAQQPKGAPARPKPAATAAPRPPAAVPAKKPGARPDAGPAPMVPDPDRDAGAPLTQRPEAANAAGGAGSDGGAEVRMVDGGARVFRFGEMEIEGRLKSPQLVYFLRRVRAEFAAGDLGHRSFSRELSDTRNDPSF